MKTVVVYESMFGNTRDIARAVAEGLSEWSSVSFADVDGADEHVNADVSLVVAGGPTHAFSMSRSSTRDDALSRGALSATHRGLREWIDDIDLDAPVPLATFDTHVTQKWVPGSASRSAAKEGRRHGFVPVAAESFYVKSTQGPLTPGELDRARTWARGLRAHVRS
ncbi:flavodoxin/nitric oxide synthase [Microbacterium sediminicola]